MLELILFSILGLASGVRWYKNRQAPTSFGTYTVLFLMNGERVPLITRTFETEEEYLQAERFVCTLAISPEYNVYFRNIGCTEVLITENNTEVLRARLLQ